MTRNDCMVVVVTKGDRDISEVLNSLVGFAYVYVWNNADKVRDGWTFDPKVYGRYLAMDGRELATDVYYTLPCVCVTQDDDVIVDWDEMLKHYEPGKLVCNMPQPWRPHYSTTGGISLMGFGAIMDHRMVNDQAAPFKPYFDAGFETDEVFLRECDRVFTYLNRDRTVWVDVPINRLDYGEGSDRMYRQSRQASDYAEIRSRLAAIGERAA